MKVKFKLYATLSQYLPEGAANHCVALDIPEGTTPNQLIDQLNIPTNLAHLVLLNGVYLEPPEREKAVFKEGDTLAVWPPVAGG